MPNLSPEHEIISFLKAIEDGLVSLVPERDPQEVYAGNVCYAASNGWQITIFTDANEWDYIDNIRTSNGRTFDFDELDQMLMIRDYEPTEDIAWSRYGIPGYCLCRCNTCGARLEKPKEGRISPPFLCASCMNK